jgi:hypothetical protein
MLVYLAAEQKKWVRLCNCLAASDKRQIYHFFNSLPNSVCLSSFSAYLYVQVNLLNVERFRERLSAD